MQTIEMILAGLLILGFGFFLGHTTTVFQGFHFLRAVRDEVAKLEKRLQV